MAASILKKTGSMIASGGSSAGSSRDHPSSTDPEEVLVGSVIEATPLQANAVELSNENEGELSAGVVGVTSTTTPTAIPNPALTPYQAQQVPSIGSNVSDTSTAIMGMCSSRFQGGTG